MIKTTPTTLSYTAGIRTNIDQEITFNLGPSDVHCRGPFVEMTDYILGIEKYALELISFIESQGKKAPEASPLVWRGLKHRLVEIVKGEEG
jgi:hypothetical protein